MTMEKNYAKESGAFMALSKMMRDRIRELDSGDKFERDWAMTRLKILADHVDQTLIELGYHDAVQGPAARDAEVG